MASTTYFHTVARSYTDVDTSKGVDTAQFLEATEGVVTLFGKTPFPKPNHHLCCSFIDLFYLLF